MDLRFVPPDLRRLDQTAAEVIACAAYSDELPMRGLAGLLDWRLAGRLHELVRASFVDGAVGEMLCVPPRPRLPFDKLLLVGVGPRAAFDEAVFRRALRQLLTTLEGLHVRRAVVELPGRSGGVFPAERATEIVLEMIASSEAHDAWWLVESHDAERRMTRRVQEEQRRARRG